MWWLPKSADDSKMSFVPSEVLAYGLQQISHLFCTPNASVLSSGYIEDSLKKVYVL